MTLWMRMFVQNFKENMVKKETKEPLTDLTNCNDRLEMEDCYLYHYSTPHTSGCWFQQKKHQLHKLSYISWFSFDNFNTSINSSAGSSSPAFQSSSTLSLEIDSPHTQTIPGTARGSCKWKLTFENCASRWYIKQAHAFPKSIVWPSSHAWLAILEPLLKSWRPHYWFWECTRHRQGQFTHKKNAGILAYCNY